MKIASICQRRIVTIDHASSLVQAAGLMREHHVGALVVTTESSEGPRVTGVVTDRDLVIDVLARGLGGTAVAIGDLASHRIASVSEDDDLDQAIAAMQESGVRRLLVVDHERRLTGIVSLDDLMAACAGQVAGLSEVIRSGIDRESAETSPLPTTVQPMLRIPAMGTLAWGPASA